MALPWAKLCWKLVDTASMQDFNRSWVPPTSIIDRQNRLHLSKVSVLSLIQWHADLLLDRLSASYHSPEVPHTSAYILLSPYLCSQRIHYMTRTRHTHASHVAGTQLYLNSEFSLVSLIRAHGVRFPYLKATRLITMVILGHLRVLWTSL